MVRPKIQLHHPYYSDTLGLDDPDGVLRGVFVGGCVDERTAWGVWENTRSHAHNSSKGEWFGWICIMKPEDVLTRSGKMTSTLAHEIAHLVHPDALHSRAWKRTVTKMGYGVEIERCGLKAL